MPAGRPQIADAGTLYSFAHQFYWDFRRLGEGSQRAWFDRGAFEVFEKALQQADVQLSESQEASVIRTVDEAIQDGRLEAKQREVALKEQRKGLLFVHRAWLKSQLAAEATVTKRIPGEADVLDELLHRNITVERVREICEDAYVTAKVEVQPGVFHEGPMLNWPISSGSVLPLYLSEHATEFIAALNDPRYPQSVDRPSTRFKQLWFLSRALAGAVFGVRTRTAINLVGSRRPEQTFEDARAAKPVRKKKRLTT